MSARDDLAPEPYSDAGRSGPSQADKPPARARKELAGYLHRVGRGLACRIDLPVLCLDDVRWTAAVLVDLGVELERLGDDPSGREPLMAVLEARMAIERARERLKAQVRAAPHSSRRDKPALGDFKKPFKRK